MSHVVGGLSGRFSSFVALLIAVAVLMSPASAQASTDSRWGVLGEMVERDFETPHMLVTLRWAEPGKRIQLVMWGAMGRETFDVELDPATDTLTHFIIAPLRRYATPLRAAPDGSILIETGKGKFAEWMTLSTNGEYQLNYGGATPLRPVSKYSKRLASLVAKGKVRAAAIQSAAGATTSAPIATRQAANSSMLTMLAGGTEARETSTVSTRGPGGGMNASPPAGLHGYVGRTFVTMSKSQPTAVVRTRWIAQGTRYEEVTVPAFGPAMKLEYEVSPDGSLNVYGGDERHVTASLDAAGLPVVEATIDSKRVQARLAQAPVGYTIVSSENRAKAGRPPKWKALDKLDMREISASEGEALLSRFAEERKKRWAPLSGMIGKTWYCTGFEPSQWLHRTRLGTGSGYLYSSPPVGRITWAEWHVPYETIVIKTKLSDGRAWTDTVELLPSGEFLMNSTGVEKFSRIKGTYDPSAKNISFLLGRYGKGGNTTLNRLSFWSDKPDDANVVVAGLDTEVVGTWIDNYIPCRMEPYNAESIARWESDLRSYQSQWYQQQANQAAANAEIARHRAETSQMLGNMQRELIGTIAGGGGSGPVASFPQTVAVGGSGSFLDQLQGMAREAQAEADASRRRLERTIDRASRQGEGPRQTLGGAGFAGEPLPGTAPSPQTARSAASNSVPAGSATEPAADMVPVYGHFAGSSGISLEAARADAFAACAKAGKSCREVETISENGYFRVEVAYETGEYRPRSKGPAKVSGE